MALLGSDWGAHPLIVPSKVAKMKIDAHPLTWNSFGFDEPFQTIPVGDPTPEPFAVGISTSRGTLAPPPVYGVDQPEPLSLIQNGLVGVWLNPQAFTRRA